jgi:hypothetical protein
MRIGEALAESVPVQNGKEYGMSQPGQPEKQHHPEVDGTRPMKQEQHYGIDEITDADRNDHEDTVKPAALNQGQLIQPPEPLHPDIIKRKAHGPCATGSCRP